MRRQSLRFALLVTLLLAGTGRSIMAQPASPLEVGTVPNRRSFVTIRHRQNPNNRIGYRFQEHVLLIEGSVPGDYREAGIDPDAGFRLERKIAQGAGVYRHQLDISEDGWAPQTWTFWLLPVQDGVELLLVVETRENGVSAYYGIQQCFRLSGATNLAWRQEIASAPAFSEFDHGAELGKAGKPPASLTHVLRGGIWESLPARNETVGARTPLGLEIDGREPESDAARRPLRRGDAPAHRRRPDHAGQPGLDVPKFGVQN